MRWPCWIIGHEWWAIKKKWGLHNCSKRGYRHEFGDRVMFKCLKCSKIKYISYEMEMSLDELNG